MRSKSDIWMPLYIGDYLADTAHLDAEQSGCYLHWLMHYWRRGPLPNSLPKLIGIGRLRSSDAPSIAQALLDEFFTLEADQCWHQKRADAELQRWNEKSLKAKDKARRAAKSRWADHAPSIAPSIPPSNAHGLLEQCPSPLPSPNTLPANAGPKQPRKTDERHAPCRAVIERYWKHHNCDPMPWDASEAKRLSELLKANPTLTDDRLRVMLGNRSRSEGVNHAERPRLWIETVNRYANGPLDRFKNPLQQKPADTVPRYTDPASLYSGPEYQQQPKATRRPA